jgi:hypothetical protein
MACVNPNTPEFKETLEKVGGNPLLAEMEIEAKNPLVETEIEKQVDRVKLDSALNEKLIDFVKKLNVDVRMVSDLQDRLREKNLASDAAAVADILHKAIFLDEAKFDSLLLAEQVASFAIEFMGSTKNPEASPIARKLLDNITEYSKYQQYYDQYKDDPIYEGKEDKIRKQILSKALAETIYSRKDQTQQKDSLKTVSMFEQLINEFLNLFNRLWKTEYYKAVDRWLKSKGIQTKGISQVSIKPFSALLNEVSDDILFGNTRKFPIKKQGKVQLSFKELMDSNAQVRNLYNKLNAIGFVLTGSPSIAQEGTIFREDTKSLHDLDWKVPPELHDTWQAKLTEAFPDLTVKINERTKKPQIFTKGESTTYTFMIDGLPVDFFVQDPSITYSKNIFGTSRWQDVFDAKMDMARIKDISDLINFKTNSIDYFRNTRYLYYSKPQTSSESQEMLQLAPQSTEAPDANLNQKIKNFLASIGVRYQAVEGLKDREGNPLSAIAMADMLNKVINVVEGRADITTLPEEAAHFFVEMLGENHPLYKEMFKQITGYKIYTEVVNTYKNNKLYRNADGTINFDKLKKEAIGKLIMANIISQDSMEENPVKDLMAEKWWKKVWERIKAILGLAPKREGAIENPFATAARQILSNDTTGLSSENLGDDIFLQQYETVGEAVFMRMLADQDRIVLSDEEKHIYSVDGKQITDTVDGEVKGRSITENIVKPWYKRMFPIDRRDDAQKAIDQMKAEYGIGLHKLIDDIVRRYVDRNTGLLKKIPSEFPKNEYNSEVNAKLDAYVKSLLYSYPEGTRFLSEVKIYNKKKNLPGTVDIVAIQKDGVVDVLDWKSQEIGANETDLKWFKEPAYRLQLEAYVQTLADDYGVLKFGKIRAIPIRTVFKFVKVSTNKWAPSSLKDIEIGPLDPSLLPDSKNYLMPVVAKNESTGDEMLDKLIVKLNGIYEKLAAKSSKDKERKYEELSKLLNTIRSLQIKRSIDNFVAIGNFEIDKYNDKLDSLTINEIMQAIEIMNVYSDGATYLMDQLRKLKTQILNEKDEKVKEQLEERQTNFTKMALNAQYMVKKLEDKANELAAEVAQNEGVRGILNPERVMDYLKRNFKSLSKLETASAQLLNKLLTKTRQERDIEIDDKFEKLGELRTKLMKWANDKGIAVEKMFDGILDGTNFLNLYSSEFLEERKRAYKRSDIQWIKDNMEFTPEMKEKYKEDFKRYKEYIESDKYSSDPKEDKEKKNAKILKWIEMNNPEESQIALLNSKNRYLKPKSIHLSEKYKDLLKPENAPLKEVYDYFQALLLDSQKAGMIEYEFGFLPSMHKSKLEALVFGDFKGLGTASNLLSSLSVDSANVFGNIDPVNGEPILDIPVYFTKDLGEDKSLDLFKVFGVWAAQTANYKAMSANEEVAKVILFVERNKGSLQTNMYGNVKPDSKINTNDINAKILERHINYHIYGKKIDLAEDKIVKVFGKEISLTRGLQKMMHYYSMNVLALNPISGTASLFGGTVNAAFIASKRAYFDDKDWAGGMIDFGRKDELSHAFLDFVSPELEDTTYRRARQLSVSQAVQKINAEDLFAFQRYSDKLVIKPVALAMFRSHMLDENNKIVYIPDYVKSKNNYENFYNLSSVERKQVQDKMNKEIEELKKTKSLKALSKIENDKFVIEGLDRNSDEITKFRAKIRKVNKTIIGNSTQEDINNIRIGILGQAFMQFRSWIPDMVTERFGDLSYDGELETYTYGKMRTFVKHLLDKRALPLIAELAIGFGENTIEKAKERYKEMVQRKQQEGDIDFPNRMSESQFIDMYIGNLRSSMRELLLILSFLVILAYLGGGDDDEKRKKTGSEKFVNRLLDKYFNELAFFYSPSETKQLIKSPLPLLGFLDNLSNFFEHSFGQTMGFALSDEEAMKENYPAKYFLKTFPIAKVGVDVGALFDDAFRKEFGIK